MNILETLSQKFTSGNNVPIEKVSISRGEYEGILDLVAEQDAQLKAAEETNRIAALHVTELEKKNASFAEAALIYELMKKSMEETDDWNSNM